MLTWTLKISSGRSIVPVFSPAGESTSMLVMNSHTLCRSAHQDQAAVGAGHCALDKEQALLGVYCVDGQVLGRDALVTHTARHAHALEHTTWGGTATDRAGRTVLALRTVRAAEALEAVTLHDTRGALALRGAHDVDLLAGLEHLGGDLLAERVLAGVGGTELDQ